MLYHTYNLKQVYSQTSKIILINKRDFLLTYNFAKTYSFLTYNFVETYSSFVIQFHGAFFVLSSFGEITFSWLVATCSYFYPWVLITQEVITCHVFLLYHLFEVGQPLLGISEYVVSPFLSSYLNSHPSFG